MAGRRPSEAITNFIAPLQKAVSYVTAGVLRSTRYGPGDSHLLTFGGGNPARLRDGAGLLFGVRHWYRIVADDPPRGPWRVATSTYYYEILDRDGREILGYHWHPEGAGDVTFPHLHTADGSLAGAHLPTGRIALEEIIRFAIEHFGVPPRVARHERWREVLAGSQARFEAWRTWP